MKALHATLLLLSLSVVSAVTSSAATSPTEAAAYVRPSEVTDSLQPQASQPAEPVLQATQTTTATSLIFLPTLVRGHRLRAACSPQSPFSLQIAALHQVVPGNGGTYTTQSLTTAEWWALYQEAFPTLMEALEVSGACWARLRVDWALIQPNPPPAPYVWGPYHDDKLRMVAETGVRLIAHVDAVPAWAGEVPYGPIAPDQLDHFAQFLSDLVKRYKEPPYNVHHWELFNEPDRTEPKGGEQGWGRNGDKYAEMLAVAFPTIKAADPEATVLMGGVAHDWFVEYGGPFYRTFPDDVIAQGGATHFDVANFHYFPDFRREWERWDPNSEDRISGWLPAPTCGDVYDGQGLAYEAGGVDLIAKASHFRNRLRTCFGVDKPVWVTELGEHGYPYDPDCPEDDPACSLKLQARYVIQGYTRGLAAGVQNITWFALVSPPYDPNEQGLLYEDDWSPKPSFRAYQTLTRELLNYRYADTLDVPGVEGYLFRDAHDHEKTVAWGSGRLTFSATSAVHIVDREGTVTVVEDGSQGDADGAQNGSVGLQMTADPVFISR